MNSQNNNGSHHLNRMEQERLRKIEAVERKQKELEDTNAAEDRILLNRGGKQQKYSAMSSQTPTPPPLPETSPPDQMMGSQNSQSQPAAARLDMLVGGSAGSPIKNGTKSDQAPPTKRVSFLTSNGDIPDERNEEYDSNANLNDEKLNRLERAEEQGPNVSVITKADS